MFEALVRSARLTEASLANVQVTGYGEKDPSFPNATPAGRSRNRRVDLIVAPPDIE